MRYPGVDLHKSNIELFDTSKQLVSYAGLATSVRQSADTTRRGQPRRSAASMRSIILLTMLSGAEWQIN
jgi:hypothetical protein